MARLNEDMYACGRYGLPQQIYCSSRIWYLQRIFKHDFFACTGLYRCPQTNQQCVLKISRLQPFWGIPLAGIGRFLRNREYKIICLLKDVRQVPKLLGTFGCNGLIYKYIEGKSLDERPVLANNFFSMLNKLLNEIHTKDICYMDLNKRGNILVGVNNHPYLIDFQISLHLPGKFLNRLRRYLQQADHYHLLKHKKRLRPDLMNKDEWQKARKSCKLIYLHRCIGNPFRYLRRHLLRFLYTRHILRPYSDISATPENDHHRFLN